MERLGIDFPKKVKINFTIFPSADMSTAPVESYNSMLAAHSMRECSDLTVLLDNQANYGIFQRNLEIDRPTYSNLNRLIAQIVSSLTSSIRFDGALNMNLSSLQTNLVPY
jgi:tubulin alpha